MATLPKTTEYKTFVAIEIEVNTEGYKRKETECYAKDTGIYIGDLKTALFLCENKKLTKLQPSRIENTIATIGYSESEQKWYGWSHRAICGFGIGDKVFDENFERDDTTPFVECGTEVIQRLSQAKRAAINFAEYVG